jgi:hypothetical protein
MASSGIADLINFVNNSGNAPRYVTVNKQRLKFQDYQNMDEFEKEELQTKSEDWSEIDAELNALNKQAEKETDPLVRELLMAKYDLLVETRYDPFGDANTDPEAPKLINKLRMKISQLEKQLEIK